MNAGGDLAGVMRALDPVIAAAARGDGRLPPERVLAQSLGIPRRKLRLALDDLEHQGAVFRRRGQGTFVSPPPATDKGRYRMLAGRLTLGQLMDVRRQLEPRLAELAATHADEPDLAALETLVQRTCSADAAEEYDLADEVFHYRIAQLADNALFLEIYDLIRQTRHEAGWRARRAEVNSPAVLRLLGQQHQRIFQAIAKADAAGAGRAQLAHMDFVASTLQMR